MISLLSQTMLKRFLSGVKFKEMPKARISRFPRSLPGLNGDPQSTKFDSFDFMAARDFYANKQNIVAIYMQKFV